MSSKTRLPDLLKDPVPSAVRHIAIPASIGTVFNTLYNFVDTYWAGQLSTESLAALTPNFTIFLLVISIGVGFSSGATALISNYLGVKDEKSSRTIFAQVISFAVIMQILLSVVLLLLLKPMFLLMSTEASVLPRAMGYGSVIVVGGLALTFNQIFNSALAARGISKPFRNSLIIGFLLNVILDPILMRGVIIGGRVIIPALAEVGIALATVLIQACTSIYLLYHANKVGALKKMAVKDFIPSMKAWKEIAEQAFPAMMNFSVLAIGTLVINFFIGRYGTTVLAAYGTALRIEQLALIPNAGLMFALSALVGQNNGAKNFDRIRESFKVTLRYGLYIMIALLTPILIFGRQLIGLISDNPDVIRIGYTYLLIQGITFYSYVILFQASSVLQGLKKPMMLVWVGLYRQVIAPAILFSFLAFTLGWEENGVWWGIVIVNWSAAFIVLWWSLRHIRKLEQQTPAQQTLEQQALAQQTLEPQTEE